MKDKIYQILGVYPDSIAYQKVREYKEEIDNPDGSTTFKSATEVTDLDVIMGDFEYIIVNDYDGISAAEIKSLADKDVEINGLRTSWGEHGELIIRLPVDFEQIKVIPRHSIITPKENAD